MQEKLKLTKIVIGLCLTLFTSFAVVGYQAIRPVLIDEQVYYELCNFSEDSNATTTNPDSCTTQTLRLDLMYTLAMSLLNGITIVTGFVIVAWGPAWTCFLGAISLCIGAILFALSTQDFPAWIPGYLLMSVGGPEILFAMFGLLNTMPHYQSITVPLLIAAADGSSVVMIIIQAFHNTYGFTLKECFLIYAIFPGALAVASFWLMPTPETNNPVPRPEQEENSVNQIEEDHMSQVPASPSGYHQLNDDNLRHLPLGRRKNWTTMMAIKSYPFWVTVVWSSFVFTASYFYFTTVSDQLEWISGDSDFGTLGAFVFSILVPSSAIFAPFASLLIKRSASVTVLAMGITGALAAIVSVLPYWKYLQFLTMIFIVFNRYLLFAAKPLIFDKLYGQIGSNTLYGIALFLVSAFAYSNYAWIYISKNMDNYAPINLILNLTGMVLSFYFAWRLQEWAPHEEQPDAPTYH